MALDDGGYLLDPGSDAGRYVNPDLRTADGLSSISALVLLGEPGIGKSTVMRDMSERLVHAANGTRVVLEDLREYSSDTLLYHRLFQAPKLETWRNGDGELLLLLDSLDEALLRIDSIASLLAAELRNWPTERLKLRISCRTAVWPHELLEPTFRELWGKDNVCIFELAPLRAEDVALAARARGVDDVKFLEAVRMAEAQAFASKPLTLNMLLNLFEKEQTLGKSAVELFEKGVLTLCEEQSPSRHARKERGKLRAAERMAIAGRIAAVTMFSNRFAIWTNPDRGDVPEEDVTLDALVGGKERVEGESVSVSRETIAETLDTGLFTARGPGRMGWAHQGYAEFLAAYHLRHLDIQARTIARMVLHPTGGLIPQLQQIAGWFAVIRTDLRRQIIGADPKAMLLSDLGAMNDHDRSAVVDEFLRALDEHRDFDHDFGIRRRYAKLRHSGLVRQLRVYVLDRSKNVVVRRAAIDIAEACAERDLEKELLTIALDESDDPHIRARAVHALSTCGSGAAILKLKPLALENVDSDPDDEIKGGALNLLWPKHITAKEMFPSLTQPKQSNLLGVYALFLGHHLANNLAPSDLLIALNWVSERANESRRNDMSSHERLQDRVFLRAWHNLDAPGVADAFARAALAHLRCRHAIFGDMAREEREQFERELSSEPEKRRQLLEAILPLLSNEREAIRIIMAQLVRSDDIQWLTKKLLEAELD